MHAFEVLIMRDEGHIVSEGLLRHAPKGGDNPSPQRDYLIAVCPGQGGLAAFHSFSK